MASIPLSGSPRSGRDPPTPRHRRLRPDIGWRIGSNRPRVPCPCRPLVNCFALTPEVVKSKLNTTTTALPFKPLWRNVVIEQLLGLSIIAAVSVLGTLPPAMSGQAEQESNM